MSSMVGATGSNSSLKGTGYKQVGTLSPQKQNLFNIGASGVSGGLPDALQQIAKMAGGGDEDFWSQLEAPALRQFNQLQGGISSRFSGMGSGARRSSGFQNTMGGAAGDLAERLQSNRMNMQQSAQDRLMQFYSQLMGIEDTALIPKKKKWWEEFLPAVGKGLGEGLGEGISGGVTSGFSKAGKYFFGE